MSINKEGWWKCWKCDAAGKKLVTFEMKLAEHQDKPITAQQAWKRVAKKLSLQVIERNRNSRWTSVHPYYEADGSPAYEFRRYDNLKTSKSNACLYRYAAGAWKCGLAGRKRILYNLPDVNKASVVLFVEGEKKADILRSLAIHDRNGEHVAVTTSGGANSWTDDDKGYFTECLRGKKVILLPDTDAVGDGYKNRISASLSRAEIDFRVVEFPGCKDFREFIDYNYYRELPPGLPLYELRVLSRRVSEFDPEAQKARATLVEFIEKERDCDWLHSRRIARLEERVWQTI